MTNEEAIEKIKKLLRMQRGGTSGEIENALNLARKLAEEHGIDLAKVNPDESSEQRRITHEDILKQCRIAWECKYAALIIDQFFKVSVFTQSGDGRRLTFVGESWDIQIAKYVYGFLVGHFRREWKRKKGRCRNRQAFMWGMYTGIVSVLRELRGMVDSEGLALIVHAEARRKQYIERYFEGKLKEENTKPDHDASEAQWRGFNAGRETKIRSGLEGQAAAMAVPFKPTLQIGA